MLRVLGFLAAVTLLTSAALRIGIEHAIGDYRKARSERQMKPESWREITQHIFYLPYPPNSGPRKYFSHLLTNRR